MAKRGLGKGLGAFFGKKSQLRKRTLQKKVSRSERKEHLMVNQGTTKKYGKRWNREKDGQQSTSKDGHEC